jgi:restriction system protein
MEDEKIKKSFKKFLNSYNSKEKGIVWAKKSEEFRKFWLERIMNNEVDDLGEEEVDNIIRIIDCNAKGNIKENESVCRVMIPQGALRNLFSEIKKSIKLKNLLNKIFNSEGREIIASIDELYESNLEGKNCLTGSSGNAINALNFMYNPDKNLSVVSLNDRKKIMDYFNIKIDPNFDKESTGKKIFISNQSIIKKFREILGENEAPRTISVFLYSDLMNYWKDLPDYQSIMLPLLEFGRDENEHQIREAIEYISNYFELSKSQMEERLPSGYDRIIDNRVGWARTYLKKAGLLEDPKRGYFKITSKGLEVLQQEPKKINVKFLKQFPEFIEFQTIHKKEKESEEEISQAEEETQTPQELIEEGITDLNKTLSSELLQKLRSNSPDFFEKVVVRLIEEMGYGKGEVVGGPYDGGIDGIIYQDVLGVDKIYLQAKRYKAGNLVSPKDIKNFIASLDIKGATKGIFITASKFVGNVEEICERTQKTIITIDGKKLVELMIEHNVGVTTKKKYEIKGIDENYFEE